MFRWFIYKYILILIFVLGWVGLYKWDFEYKNVGMLGKLDMREDYINMFFMGLKCFWLSGDYFDVNLEWMLMLMYIYI